MRDILRQVKERQAYEDSLKYYRDLQNVVDTSREEGREEERQEIALNLLRENISIEVVSRTTGLSVEVLTQRWKQST